MVIMQLLLNIRLILFWIKKQIIFLFNIRDKILPGAIVSKSKPGSIQGWTIVIQNSNNKNLNIFIINVDTLLKYND